MPQNADSIVFNNIKTVDILKFAKQQATKTNLDKEQIEFVSHNTDIKTLEQYLEIVDNMIQKEENKGFLAILGNTILSVFGFKSVNIKSLKALQILITERINQLKFTA